MLKLGDKILRNEIAELDDLFTADVMSEIVEESTKEALDVEQETGGLGSSGKTNGSSSDETKRKGTWCSV